MVHVRAKVLLNSSMLEEMKVRIKMKDWNEREPAHHELARATVVASDTAAKTTGQGVPVDCWENFDYFVQYWNMNQKEAQVFAQLRDWLKDEKHSFNTPNYVVRCLRVHDFNLYKAKAMVTKILQWRDLNKADTILQDFVPPRDFLEKYPGAILQGTDWVGDPVYLSRMGVTDLVGLVTKYGHDECIKYEIYKRESTINGEWMEQWERHSGRPIRRVIVIEDMEGLSHRMISPRVISLYREAMRLDQDNYPETAKKIIVIRVPAVFRIAWSIAKHFFDHHVVDKMEFCGPNNYLDHLSQYMDLDILPPVIYPDGHGRAVEGFPQKFEGGLIELN
jgi:hypothetical protein